MNIDNKNSIKNFLVAVTISVLVGSLGTITYYHPQIKKMEQINNSYKNEMGSLNSEISFLKDQVSENILKIEQLENIKKIFYGNISAQQANNLINVSEINIVDVRMETEYNTTHIEGAINIPLNELEERLDEIDKMMDVIVYCKSGYRSSYATEILFEHGYERVYNLIDGISGWVNLNFPTLEGEGCPCQDN